MGNIELDKKEKIIQTALKLFEEKGFEGVKMRTLAEQADVNKGLLHYYFKNKEAVFLQVFQNKASFLYLSLDDILQNEELTFPEKVRLMVDGYFKLISSNPKLPVFVISEVNKNPSLVNEIELPEKITHTMKLLQIELVKIGIKNERAGFHFLLSLISLCVFPFMMEPMIRKIHQTIPGSMDISAFMVERRSQIISTLINSVKS
ncbi:MAG: TetR/AcrR family transcriptional regulator [Bacteroidetes bacterium]|nr:TetR/AcrR family transcriptional regulator [Bacteroidota bacterium]MDA1121295.1 TetR/AcrR family transcriptional regulator [Bacteroidota bacterium]